MPATQRSNKRIIWEHFTDTLWLIILELVLQVGLDLIEPFVPHFADVLQAVHVFSKWFVIAALGQFAIGSSLDLAAKDAHLVRQILRTERRPKND